MTPEIELDCEESLFILSLEPNQTDMSSFHTCLIWLNLDHDSSQSNPIYGIIGGFVVVTIFHDVVQIPIVTHVPDPITESNRPLDPFLSLTDTAAATLSANGATSEKRMSSRIPLHTSLSRDNRRNPFPITPKAKTFAIGMVILS